MGLGDRESDYAGKDVTGKIVIGSGPIGPLHARAVQIHHALGVLSWFNPTGKPIDRPTRLSGAASAAGVTLRAEGWCRC